LWRLEEDELAMCHFGERRRKQSHLTDTCLLHQEVYQNTGWPASATQLRR
jgi:hypothetical protein